MSDMDDRELEALFALFRDMESDRIERKASDSDRNKIRQAICAFAHDLPFAKDLPVGNYQ